MPLSNNKVTSFTFLHANQNDDPNPNYASSTDFKAAIDTQATQLQTGLNGLIDALMSIVAGSSGAEQIGSASITGVAGNTIYAQLADLKAQLNGAVAGSIPDGSLTTAKYQDGSVTPAKLSFDPATQAEMDMLKLNNYRMISMGGMF